MDDQYTAAHAKSVQHAIEKHASRPGGLLPLLHEVQEALGFVPPQALAGIAKALNLSRAEVHGVMTFYPDFRAKAPGAHVLKICRAEACQAMQADALIAHAKSRLGVEFHETTVDGAVTLEPVYCLGNCACSPAVMFDGEVHGRVTPARLDALLTGSRS